MRPDCAERPQAQVNAIYVAIRVALGKQRDERLADARVVRIGVERTRAVAGAAFGEREHEIDVRGEIELAAAELAQAKHDHALRRTVHIADHAMTRRDPALCAGERGLDAGFREHRRAGERRLDSVEIVEIAPDQPKRFAQAKAGAARP